jgi:hypothetical protein
MAKTGESWISTYDAIMSILWKSITRSKLDLLHPDLAKEVILVHAVNTRKILDPPLQETMMGNAVAPPRTEPIKISELIAENNLPEIAQRVRNSIKTITPQYLAELPEWIAGLEDRRWISINMRSFLGMDLAGTSWQGMNVYQNTISVLVLRKPSGFRIPSSKAMFLYTQAGRMSRTMPSTKVLRYVCAWKKDAMID